jgi:hypothetical protein
MCLCLSLASLPRMVLCLWVRQEEPLQVRSLSGAPFYNRLLALPTNNRLGWKGLSGTTLAYYKKN